MTGPAQELERTLFELRRVVVGQDTLLERMLVALLARGHCLLEGVPGVAKTLAVETLARAVGGSFARLQFTPDLVPSDIGGTSYPLPTPFLVLATQNPIESEGVYALPEAQRDRFLLKVDVGYPSGAEELAILHRMGVRPPVATQVLTPHRVLALQDAADRVFVHHAVADYVVRLVLATRDPGAYGLGELAGVLDFGASPRATLGTAAAARALALLRGREYVLPEDVRDVLADVVAHRLVLSYDAVADGVDPRWVVDRVQAAVPPPRIAPARDDQPVQDAA